MKKLVQLQTARRLKTLDREVGQCQDLLDRGIPGIHFYVLNRSQACETILKTLGHR